MDGFVIGVIIVLVLYVGVAIGSGVIAHNKGRSAIGWALLSLLAAVLTFIGGIVVLLIAAFMPKVEPPPAHALAQEKPPPVYDTKTWDELVQTDFDIAMSVAQVAPYGQYYVAELAAATLAPGGRSKLADNTARLVAQARADREGGK